MAASTAGTCPKPFASDLGRRKEGQVPFPLSRLLFDPGRRPGVECAGRLPSRRLQAATARSGGQGRRPLAPGPEPRAATRRPAWAEHGEHGEDPPLARSEHRGTAFPRARLMRVRLMRVRARLMRVRARLMRVRAR